MSEDEILKNFEVSRHPLFKYNTMQPLYKKSKRAGDIGGLRPYAGMKVQTGHCPSRDVVPSVIKYWWMTYLTIMTNSPHFHLRVCDVLHDIHILYPSPLHSQIPTISRRNVQLFLFSS